MCTLLLPLGLLHARAAAEALIGVVGVLFLWHSATTGDWRWLRRPFAVAAALWWVWLVACSLRFVGGWLALGHALAAVRFPVLAIAVGGWVLAKKGQGSALDPLGAEPPDPHSLSKWISKARPLMGSRGKAPGLLLVWLTLLLSALWIAAECWQQMLTGHNLFGAGRYMDGALTGPFAKPRAGPALILILFPVLLPPLDWVLRRRALVLRLAGWALLGFAVATMVLIGQRMPTLLLAVGLVLSGLLLRPLRLPVLGALLAGGMLVAALPAVSPPTYAKLVQHFAVQMRDFRHSDYGLIFARAAVIAQNHPWMGQGFDGFRERCADPATFHGAPALGIADEGQNGGLLGCNIHPHNYYLEMADDAGLPGVALFVLMVGCLLVALARRARSALGVGVLVAAVLAFWPVASTSTLFGLPDAGWIFLVAGVGLALQGWVTDDCVQLDATLGRDSMKVAPPG